MFTATAQAQFKQAGGENNLQLLFAPLSDTPFSLNDNTIMYRKFNATGTSAFRIGLNIGSNSSTDVLVQAGDTITGLYPDTSFRANFTLVPGLNPQADQTDKTFSFSIRPGYEMHFAGTDRLSPYWGAELLFSKSSTKSETDQIREGNYTVTFFDTASVNPTVNNPYTIYTVNQKSGSTTFGINLIAGFDYYFAKNLSIGGEISFGYSNTSFSDFETEIIKPTVTTTNSGTFPNGSHTVSSTNAVTSAPDQKRGSSSGFGPGVVGQIKIGWLF